MAEMTLNLEQALALVNREAADPELRAVGGATAVALLLKRVTEHGDDELLQLLDRILDHALGSLDEAIDRVFQLRTQKSAAEKSHASGT